MRRLLDPFGSLGPVRRLLMTEFWICAASFLALNASIVLLKTASRHVKLPRDAVVFFAVITSLLFWAWMAGLPIEDRASQRLGLRPRRFARVAGLTALAQLFLMTMLLAGFFFSGLFFHTHGWLGKLLMLDLVCLVPFLGFVVRVRILSRWTRRGGVG